MHEDRGRGAETRRASIGWSCAEMSNEVTLSVEGIGTLTNGIAGVDPLPVPRARGQGAST